MRKLFNIIIYTFAIIGFIFVSVYLAMEIGLTKTKGVIDTQHDYFKNQINQKSSWQSSEEWKVLKEAVAKDAELINRVSKETGVPSRMIVTPLVVEQMRLFSSEREIFKEIFAPLKILGNQSQFSWGVMGIKQDTAKEIESRDSEHLLYFKTDDPDKERFERLTDEHNRYYSYLYGAILIKEIEEQWKDAGFPIEDKPGIIATLYNIGFKNSRPNANPQVGGAEIEINKTTYSFGGLAQSFYDSDELTELFPTSSPRQ